MGDYDWNAELRIVSWIVLTILLEKAVLLAIGLIVVNYWVEYYLFLLNYCIIKRIKLERFLLK